MTNDEIRASRDNGNFPWEILHELVAAGVEYPDAVWKVSQALRMDAEEVEEMEDKYLDLC